jgi:uncharacterized membrane protein YgcG
MDSTTRRVVSRLLIVATALPLLGAGVTRAAEAEVADGGGFFSAEALSEAGDIVLSIQSLYGRDVRVETYAEVPEQLKARLRRDGQDKFYDDWLNGRARALGVRGVFILVTRTPGRVQVGVDKPTQRRAFSAGDRDALRDALATAFKAGRYDQGLLDGLKFVRRRLDENAARDRSPGVPVARANP